MNNKTNADAPAIFGHPEQQLVRFNPRVIATISRAGVIVAPSLEYVSDSGHDAGTPTQPIQIDCSGYPLNVGPGGLQAMQ